jgi:hypothetical protein
MATARGDEPGRYTGDRYGDQPPTGARRRPERPPSLLSEIADVEPDRLTFGRRLGAAVALVVVVLALAVAAGVLVYALFGLIG